MTLFILTFLLIGLAMLGMALGVIVSGRSFSSRCGGGDHAATNCRACAGVCKED